MTAAQCATCGRFVGNVTGHTGFNRAASYAPGPYLARVTGVCKTHGEVEATRDPGWGWDDFDWPAEVEDV